MLKAVQLRPIEGAGERRIVKIRIRVTLTAAPTLGTVTVADVLLQAGGTATGWVPHVTEMPWTAGVLG